LPKCCDCCSVRQASVSGSAIRSDDSPQRILSIAEVEELGRAGVNRRLRIGRQLAGRPQLKAGSGDRLWAATIRDRTRVERRQSKPNHSIPGWLDWRRRFG
jgi:hypothetical protein